MSGVLRTKERSNMEWEKILTSQAWTLNQLPHGIMPALYLSYEDLPSHLKQCFILSSGLQKVLYDRAEEQMTEEDLADNYYSELVTRRLLQIIGKGFGEMDCKMYHLV